MTAADGAAALALIAAERPDLVFLDVMMPRMNGYEVCRAVRSDLGLTDVTIVLLTAKGQDADRVQGLAVGADEFRTNCSTRTRSSTRPGRGSGPSRDTLMAKEIPLRNWSPGRRRRGPVGHRGGEDAVVDAKGRLLTGPSSTGRRSPSPDRTGRRWEPSPAPVQQRPPAP